MGNTTVGERAVALLIENGYGTRENFEGCPEGDLRNLERRYSVTLPEAYKSCMRYIGRHPGTFLRGSHFTYPEVELQTKFAREWTEDDDTDFEFLDGSFVFRGLQGYAFDYFNTKDGEDPPVYLFTQFDDAFESRRQTDSFSEWLFKKIES